MKIQMSRIKPCWSAGLAIWVGILAGLASTATSAVEANIPVVRETWTLAEAYRETTPTRERICINGLWRWQPAAPDASQVPDRTWGYFKVPGCWPGISNYMQKDSQIVHAHPSWRNRSPAEISAAWYEREIQVPASWNGRRISLNLEYLNSYAAVYVNGKEAGEARFPGGEVDLTSHCEPGRKYRLSLLVVALPLRGVMMSYSDSASAREVRGTVPRRGLCGDVYLAGTPAETRIADIRLATSVRRQELTVDIAVTNLTSGAVYEVRGRILEEGHIVKEFNSSPFRTADVRDGRHAFNVPWMPDRRWDIHTPENIYKAEISLRNHQGEVLDTGWKTRFGFREFWIDGRDFYLNGTRLWLSAVPLDNAQISAALATYKAARESLERLKSFGINLIYTHNYGCTPGSHLSFEEILRAADDTGMLVSFSQPHFSHYDWQPPGADRENAYARHAQFYVRTAQNHPSVVMYSMSHNATGYSEDMNPDMIDGIHAERDSWALRNAKRAVRAEAIVRKMDPSRIIYHHASGNLGSLHAINFYPNFVPIQEMSDWFEHWATEGVKPVFLCEYGTPFTWDWSMYRGWYQGKREFGSAMVPWEFCLAEWNSQFFGDRAFAISEMEKRNLRWEAAQFRAGKVWHRWDYPHRLSSNDFPEREPVMRRYLKANWRAFRTWGLSAISPWEHHTLFKLRPGVERNRRVEYATDWHNLQRPGFSPDFQEERYERMDLAYARSDWLPTDAGAAILRNNQPLLAYLGGKPGGFTAKDHIFHPGESIEKQLILINNSRTTVSVQCTWSLPPAEPANGETRVTIETGRQARIPIRFRIPDGAPTGEYRLHAEAQFSHGTSQSDTFLVHLIPSRKLTWPTGNKVGLFDPRGETAALLRDVGLPFERVKAQANVDPYDLFIVGKAGLTVDGPAPNIEKVRDGLKVVIFEQTPEVLEQRFGFRIAAYGLRNVFPRVPDHPVLAGLNRKLLRDWRGAATLIPPRLEYERDPRFNGAPTVQWCGIPVTRAWRCGHRGNVASVSIEKPARGDFLPIVDGGFSLQYSPLLEFHEGKSIVLFCQMDVTGRTESEPAARTLAINLLEYANAWEPPPQRTAFFAGSAAGRTHLEAAGFELEALDKNIPPADSVIVLTQDSALPVDQIGNLGKFLDKDGRVLAVGLSQTETDAFFPHAVNMEPAEYINAFFPPPDQDSPLAGIGPADVHNRAPRILPLVTDGPDLTGNGVLAVTSSHPKITFCQLAPWDFAYQNNFGLKRTFRRTSFLVTRLLTNLGVPAHTPTLKRFSSPVAPNAPGRWLHGLYLDNPEEWDDPYRFFRW